MFEANTIIQEHIIHLIGLLIQNLIISEVTIYDHLHVTTFLVSYYPLFVR